MASYFQSLFNRRLNVNVYGNTVQEPVTFEQLTFLQLEMLYSILPDARIVEDFISDNIVKIPVRVVNRRDTEVKNTELNQLVQQTNGTQSWAEFLKEALITYGLTGNVFIKRDPETGYLYNLPTSAVYIQLGLEKTLPEYMNFIAGYTLEIGGHRYPIELDDMLQIKTSTLYGEDGLWTLGVSPYQAGNKNIKTLNANYSSRVSIIRDRGALGFISNDSEVPDAEQSRIVQDALETYGTREEQKKFIVTTQRLRYQQMSLGIAELQLLENLQYDFDIVAQLRGLDSAIFKSEGSTFDNQEQARKAAIKNTIIPVSDKFYDKINEFLRPYYGGLRLQPAYEEMPEYGEINKELSDKVIAEVDAGLLTPEQGLNILYGDEIKYEVEEPEPIPDELELQPEQVNGN